MGINYNNIAERLLECVPEFHPEQTDVRDNIVYLVFEDLVRFVKVFVQKAGQDELLRRIFNFIEQALRDGDPRVVEMLRDVFIELALLDSVRVKHLMGPLGRKLLKRVQAEVYR
jgi:hypothetical protein